MDAWRQYAAGIRKTERDTGAEYTPNAFNAYTSLAAKFYAANAGVGTAPTTPPTTPFNGDAIVVTAAAASGKVTFTGTGSNAPNVITELYLQPLKNANRKPSATGYRIKGYYVFSSAAPTFQVTVPAGLYAAAYRYVNKTTGQVGPLVTIPVTGVALTLSDGEEQTAPAAARKKAA